MSATPTDVPNLVQICPWGLLGNWVNYNEASRLHSGEVKMDNITFLWFLRVFFNRAVRAMDKLQFLIVIYFNGRSKVDD